MLIIGWRCVLSVDNPNYMCVYVSEIIFITDIREQVHVLLLSTGVWRQVWHALTGVCVSLQVCEDRARRSERYRGASR